MDYGESNTPKAEDSPCKIHLSHTPLDKNLSKYALKAEKNEKNR